MAKLKKVYECRSCGSSQHRWMGKCPDCNAWDSLEERAVNAASSIDPQRGDGGWSVNTMGTDGTGTPVATPIADVGAGASDMARLPTHIAEFDRVLGKGASGAGLVPGSAVLFGGEPGIGKSTLLLQAAGAWADAPAPSHNPDWKTKVLYVTSEESAEQVRLRASRLGVAESPGLYVLADTNLARIIEQARKVNPAVLVLDSVQMVYKADLDAAPGSISQLRRCAAELVFFAKSSGIAVILVGHVTKDGQLAGPRLLEHLVDTVLTFEGDRYHASRLVRAVKNRFGTTLELGIFEMAADGLREIPGGMSVSAESEPAQGAAVAPIMHGSRCVLVELQALTATGFLGNAKRKASGVDSNRLAMLIAVLEQHAELRLADRDIFCSAVGGIRVTEPAGDLALLLAVAGAHYKRALEAGTIVIGEVGLGGEIRAVPQLEQRLIEASKLGYKRAIVPITKGLRAPKGLELVQVKNVDRAIEQLG